MRRQITAAEITETAVRLADEQGLDQVNLSRIAERLGIKKQSLYNHIEGLEDVKCSMVIYACGQLRTVLTEAAVGQSRENAVFSVAYAYRKFAHEHSGQYQVIMTESWKYKKDEKLKFAIHLFMQVIRKVLSQYDLHDIKLTHAVRGLRSMMHGFVSLEASGWFQNPTDTSESYQQLIKTYISGVEAWEIQKKYEE